MRKGGYSWNTVKAGTLSQDGTTYWNGGAWVPAVTPDGLRWNGREWEGQPSAKAISTGLATITAEQVGFFGAVVMALLAVNTYWILVLGGGRSELIMPGYTFLACLRRLRQGRVLGALVLAAAFGIAYAVLWKYRGIPI